MLNHPNTFATIVAGGLLLAASSGLKAETVYAGQGVVVKANVAGIVNISASDTGALPSNGGSLAVSLANLSVPPTLDLHLLAANTVGEFGRTRSEASVVDVTINLSGIYITASVVNSNANAECFGDHAEVSGGSTLVGLKVNGWPVKITGKPNQTVPLLVGSLVINEQVAHVTAPPDVVSGDMVVNALHLKVLALADVVVSSSHAGVTCFDDGVPE